MGIKGLFPFLSASAPSSIKPKTLKDYTNRVLAIDASTCLYQFIIAVRSESEGFANLTNDRGEVTSHITGFLSRTLRLLEAGIKPVYVFDGRPPDLKARELRERDDRRETAAADEKAAREAGSAARDRVEERTAQVRDLEAAVERARSAMEEAGPADAAAAAQAAQAAQALPAARAKLAEAEAEAQVKSSNLEKATHRSAKVTQQHHEDAKELLNLMGVPVVQAPGEAEATCAALCREGLAFAATTEDMDVLTFGAPIMVKNLFDTENNRMGTSKGAADKKPVFEVHLGEVLQVLDLTMEQFVDFCILCGCDYLTHLQKVGPTTAIKLIAQHGSLDKVMAAKALPEAARKSVPDDWPYDQARQLFLQPDVAAATKEDLAQKEAKFDELRTFLIHRHSFNESRVDTALKRLRGCKSAKTQTRLDQFFAVSTSKSTSGAGTPKYDPFAKKRKGSPGSSTTKGAAVYSTPTSARKSAKR